MSQRSSEVHAGKMTSANWASFSIQIDWFTTNSSDGWRYASMNLPESGIVPSEEEP